MRRRGATACERCAASGVNVRPAHPTQSALAPTHAAPSSAPGRGPVRATHVPVHPVARKKDSVTLRPAPTVMQSYTTWPAAGARCESRGARVATRGHNTCAMRARSSALERRPRWDTRQRCIDTRQSNTIAPPVTGAGTHHAGATDAARLCTHANARTEGHKTRAPQTRGLPFAHHLPRDAPVQTPMEADSLNSRPAAH